MQHSASRTETRYISPAVSSVPSAPLTGVERKWFAVLDVLQSSGFGKLENEQEIAIAQKSVVEKAVVSDIVKAEEKSYMAFIPVCW